MYQVEVKLDIKSRVYNDRDTSSRLPTLFNGYYSVAAQNRLNTSLLISESRLLLLRHPATKGSSVERPPIFDLQAASRRSKKKYDSGDPHRVVIRPIAIDSR